MKWDLPSEILEKAKGIKLIVLDVDGVLTDGKIIINSEGVESKNFYVRDGMALCIAREKGYLLAIISARYSRVVEHRASELGIHEIHQNVTDKLKIFHSVLDKFKIEADQAAFIGDDVNDISVMKAVGFSAAPRDADENAKLKADFISRHAGGEGAVREFIELILTQQNNWEIP